MACVLNLVGVRSVRRALLLALGLLAIAPSGAAAFYKAIWGSEAPDQFPLYHQLGVNLFEDALNWGNIAPTRPSNPSNPSDPAYRWPAAIDTAIAQAHKYHMRVLLQIIYSPPWAVAPGHRYDWAPVHPSDYATFAAAAARRYPSVHLWMIWGEPNKVGNFEPLTPNTQPLTPLNADQKMGPRTYAQLLDDAYGALKRVSKHNLVIGGSTYTGGLGIPPKQFIENMRLPNGRPPRMDIYAHNPFGYWDPSFSAPASELKFDEQNGLIQFIDLPELARLIDRYLHPGLPIFLSEYTIPTKQDEEFDFHVNPKVAARYIRDAFRISRRWHRIYGLGWIHVYDDPPYSYGGLLDANGHKKPLFSAFEHG